MGIMLEIDHEVAESIVEKELLDSIEMHKDYLNEYRFKDHRFIAMYDTDPRQDQQKIRKMIRALELVRSIYTVGGKQNW